MKGSLPFYNIHRYDHGYKKNSFFCPNPQSYDYPSLACRCCCPYPTSYVKQT